jgi:UDP-N-acetylmuramoyl-L-alanyl-D-glutamate--2,6-diaminopimelate ligase
MASIAEKWSDVLVVTSDNPRSEDPQQIITDVLAGIKSLNSGNVFVEIDRESAIRLALKEARKEDLVVVAGKGHEDYQILADKTIHFDDREVVCTIMNELKAQKVGNN